MSKISYDLTSLYRQAVHFPRVSKDTGGSLPLYPRVPNSQSDDSYSSDYYKEIEKNAMYMKAAQSSYNSPTNIRRLLITGTQVVVNFYAAPMLKGKRAEATFTRKLKDRNNNEINLKEVIKDKLLYNVNYNRYLQEKTFNGNAVEPQKIEIKGSAIGILASPWVLSNIEEIYFDWTVLASEDVAVLFRNYSGAAQLQQFYMNRIPPKIDTSQNSVILEWFSRNASGNVKDITKRFPRLKYIGIISNLDDVIEKINSQGHVFADLKNPSYDSENKSRDTWLISNADILKNSYIMLGTISNKNTLLNPNFISKEYIYKFDSEILAGYFASLRTKIEAARLKSSVSREEAMESTEDMGELEKELVEIRDKYGDAAIKQIKFVFRNSHDVQTATDTLKYIYSGFTYNNKKIFKPLFFESDK